LQRRRRYRGRLGRRSHRRIDDLHFIPSNDRERSLRPRRSGGLAASIGGMQTTPISPYVVETTGLTKSFGERTVVRGVDLRVPRGSAFGYLGPNGAGKTTLIRMLLGLTAATSGTMRLLGYSVPSQRKAALAKVGAIVEEPSFHGHLTGRENLRIVAAARGPATVARIDASLER